MKYGVMVYHVEKYLKNYHFRNIGDYIQSKACYAFLSPDTFVDREELNQYTGEPLKMIMNGWYMHNPNSWPPSEMIDPLYVAFHITKGCKDLILSPNGVEYLRKHDPIGCRDRTTLSYLQEKGVSSYFSGCLTLTLGLQYQHQSGSSSIYFVDPYLSRRPLLRNVFGLVHAIMKKYSVISSISQKMRLNNCQYRWGRKSFSSLRMLIHAALFYKVYSPGFDDDVLLHAEYITHNILPDDFMDDEDIFRYTDLLLRKYASASLVITSRLHCALPCLAMGTPCIFISEESLKSDGRFDGLHDLLFSINYLSHLGEIDNTCIHNLFHGKITEDTVIPVPEKHRDIRNGLIKTCREFVNNSPHSK